ncbi:MAG: hypothetical protein JKY12_06575 [Sneathiella sp.]|nr:hypothetical protein [Sneathiella sp.]
MTGNPKREGALPWLVEVFPLGNLDGSIDHHFKGAAVFITDPEKKEVISTKGMQALFELTDAEAEICASLLRDCRLIRSLRAATAALAPCVARLKCFILNGYFRSRRSRPLRVESQSARGAQQGMRRLRFD